MVVDGGLHHADAEALERSQGGRSFLHGGLSGGIWISVRATGQTFSWRDWWIVLRRARYC